MWSVFQALASSCTFSSATWLGLLGLVMRLPCPLNCRTSTQNQHVCGKSKCRKQHASPFAYSYIIKCVQSYFNTPIHTCFVGDQNIISKIAGLSFFLRLFFLYLILFSAGRFIERDTILKPSTHAMWNLTCETPVKCPYWRWLSFVVTPYPMLKDSGAGSLCPIMVGNHDVYWVRYVDLALTLTWLSPKRTKTTQF